MIGDDAANAFAKAVKNLTALEVLILGGEIILSHCDNAEFMVLFQKTASAIAAPRLYCGLF